MLYISKLSQLHIPSTNQTSGTGAAAAMAWAGFGVISFDAQAGEVAVAVVQAGEVAVAVAQASEVAAVAEW